MFNKILVVCAGNICRSPLGEYMLKAKLPTKQVDSAGLVAKNGDRADVSSIKLAKADGLDLSAHQARRLTTELCAKYDLILVMEPQHQKDIMQKFPQASGKTMLLGKWIGVDEIPDPYKMSIEAFEHAYKLIDQSVTEWAKRLG